MAAAKVLFGSAVGVAEAALVGELFVRRRDEAGVAEGVSGEEDTSPSTGMKLAA